MKEEITEILEVLINNNTIKQENIPDIDLYIDQLTTFIESNIYTNKENVLTKSMINNYCKNKVIENSVKKKYTKSHIMFLIMIYNMKSVISINDIKNIFDVVRDEDVSDYYDYLTQYILEFNPSLVDQTLLSFDKISESEVANSDKSKIAILASQLAIEANYKKMLSEILIEKYLKNM